MAKRLVAFLVLGAVALVLLSGYAAYAALQSCAVKSSFLSHLNGCPTTSELALKSEIAALDAKRTALLLQIETAERALAARQCVAQGPDANAPLLAQSWADQDLSSLYGCWSLGSSYQTRDVDTQKVISYPSWSMCFDTQGNGKQVMRGDDGSSCEGPVTARFASASSLILGEGGNLVCSDGGYIHRRDIACGRADGGGVSCSTLQPETEGAADVPLTRWQ